MRRIDPSAGRLPLFEVAALRAIERRALAATPPGTLMRRAGEAVARLALAIAPHAERVRVLAGPGNNGGDGIEAAVHLHRAGKDVRVSFFGDEAGLPDDARDALARARAADVRFDGSAALTLQAHDVAIDALLGIGGARPPGGALAEALREFNALPCVRLAVDVPSGLNVATGQPFGDTCAAATHTLALLALEPGLFTGSGRDLAGEIWLDELDVDPSADPPDAWLTGHSGSPAARRHAQHKGSFGDVAVVGGTHGMVGAALLAGRAAHAAGAGRVFVDLLDDAAGPVLHDAVRPELMFRPGWWRGAPEVLGRSTVVCGCGGGDAVRAALPRLLSRARRLVLDADALNAIAADAALEGALRDRARRGRGSVLTPHPLEAGRLLGRTAREVQADRLAAARALAAKFDCVVVLKGSGSIIAAPNRPPHVNATGNAALATAGTGDVLAGWLGGLWAEAGSAPDAMAEAFDAATRAVAEHGAAAEPAAPGPLRAGDLIETLHRRLRRAAPDTRLG